MIYYDQCDAIINGTGILATDASISNNASLTPIRVIGKRGILTQSPVDDITSTLQINYFFEINNDPNFSIVEDIKAFFLKDEIYKPKPIVIGGVSGEYYLNSYSIKALPNEAVMASASYLSFGGLSGNFITKNPNILYNKSNGGDIGAFVFITNLTNFSTNKNLSFDYSFTCNWQPINVIGVRKVKEVKLLSAQEVIKVKKENYYNVTFSGEKASSALFGGNENDSVKIYGFSFAVDNNTANAREISLSGFRVNQTAVNVSVDNFLLSDISFVKYY